MKYYLYREATDTPDRPGSERKAVIANDRDAYRLKLSLGASAGDDNARARALIAALNAHPALVSALRSCAFDDNARARALIAMLNKKSGE